MSAQPVSSPRSLEPLVIAFLDVSLFSQTARGLEDEAVASLLDEFYRSFDDCATSSGGRVVKFLGDGALLVWPQALADAAVDALLSLRETVAGQLARRGHKGQLVVRVHAGSAIVGEFGGPNSLAFDVIGRDVITAAKLDAKTMSVSADAFRKLSPKTRQRLVKHTAPVVYIPAGDPRP